MRALRVRHAAARRVALMRGVWMHVAETHEEHEEIKAEAEAAAHVEQDQVALPEDLVGVKTSECLIELEVLPSGLCPPPQRHKRELLACQGELVE